MPADNPHHNAESFSNSDNNAKTGNATTANSSPAEEFSDSA